MATTETDLGTEVGRDAVRSLHTRRRKTFEEGLAVNTTLDTETSPNTDKGLHGKIVLGMGMGEAASVTI